MIYQPISKYEFSELLADDFSREASKILYDYLDDLSDVTDTPFIADATAIRIDYTECSLKDFIDDFIDDFDEEEDDIEDTVGAYLEYQGVFFKILNNGSVVFECF